MYDENIITRLKTGSEALLVELKIDMQKPDHLESTQIYLNTDV